MSKSWLHKVGMLHTLPSVTKFWIQNSTSVAATIASELREFRKPMAHDSLYSRAVDYFGGQMSKSNARHAMPSRISLMIAQGHVDN